MTGRQSLLLFATVGAVCALIYGITGLLQRGRGDSTAAAPGPAYAGKLRFLALGDSYTIGESVAPSDRWAVQLAARMRRAGVDLSDPIIIARSGWTTGDLLAAMESEKPSGQFDLVTVLIGVNNQYQGRGEDEYRRQFAEVLNRASGLAGGQSGRVVVLSIPDWSVTPFGRQSKIPSIAEMIDRFNQINREESVKAGAAYVDITPGSRRAATQPSWVAADGLHPSKEQYTDWVTAAFEIARAAVHGR